MKMLLLSNVSNADTPTSQIHLARALCDRHSILYVDTLGNRGIGARGARDMRKILRRVLRAVRGAHRIEGGLWAVSPLVKPGPSANVSSGMDILVLRPQVMRAMRRARVWKPDLVWVASPSGVRIADMFPEIPLVYYCTDDTAAFPAVKRESVLSDEASILRRALLVVAVSENLAAVLRARGARQVLVLENGVQTGLFENPPADAIVTGRSLMMGFAGRKTCVLAGVIDDRTDLGLLEDAVARCPHVEFVVVGPVMPSHRERLPVAPNLHFVGARSHAVVAALVSLADVCIAPYSNNEVVRKSSPLKVLEYLAAGKPVVATPVAPLRPLSDVIRLAADGASFAAEIGMALVEGPEGAVLRRNRVRSRSWDAVSKELENALEEVLASGRELSE